LRFSVRFPAVSWFKSSQVKSSQVNASDGKGWVTALANSLIEVLERDPYSRCS